MSPIAPLGQESLEAAVFESLVRAAGDHGSALQAQFASATAMREMTPSGFYLTFEQPSGGAPIPFTMLDADAIARGKGLETQAEFILRLKGGWITELEGFAYSDWPNDVRRLELIPLMDERALEADEQLGK